MKKHVFKGDHFTNEDAVRAWFEASRWPDGPVCPHCGSLKQYATKKAGRYRCAEKECRKDFTVTTKSVMERSHVPLTAWAVAFHLYASSKKGFTATQLQRTLGCEYNTAWFMHHRVMEAMRRGGLEPPLGGEGKIVEADETYYGPVAEEKRRATTTKERKFTKGGRSGPSNKRAIVALVERGRNVRTFHVAAADKDTVQGIVRNNIARESRLHTDESRLYTGSDEHFAAHETVTHSHGEYVRNIEQLKDGKWHPLAIHTNSAEGFFGLFKRGMRGNYQHCAEKNLHRYLAEYEFRYNTRALSDGERAALAVRNASGKRLTYRQPH
jgi:transposase-like protein